jgi:glycine betaine/proline transport system substrate-binding protein
MNAIKKLTLVLVMTLIMTVIAFAQPVRIVTTGGMSGAFVDMIVANILIEMGYDVEGPIRMKTAVRYTALATGDADITTQGWYPLHSKYKEQYGKSLQLVGKIFSGGNDGFVIDKATADKYGITSLSDFANPEIAKLFDTDNNGKANFVGCPAGWSCNDLAKAIFEELGIAGNIDYQAGEYDPSIADVIARYKNGQPVFYYMWTPNYVASAIPLGTESVWLNSKYNTSGGSAETKDEWGCVTNPCYLVVVNDVVAVVNPVFAKENARVIKLLEQLQIPIADIVALAGKVYNESLSKDDVNELAKAWIANNRETVDEWLSNVGND